MDSLQSLGQTGRQVTRLKELAEVRLNKLYGCQKLWFCIEEITKVRFAAFPVSIHIILILKIMCWLKIPTHFSKINFI